MARCHCGWMVEENCIKCGWVKSSPDEICAIENCSKPTAGKQKYCSKECLNVGTKCVADGCDDKKAGMRDYCMKHSILWTKSKNQNLVCIARDCKNPRIKNTRFCSTNCYQTHNRSSTKVVQSNKENDSPSNSNEEFVKCNVAKCRNEVKGTANGGYCESHKWRINRMVCIESGCSLLTKNDELFCFTHNPVNRNTKPNIANNSSTINTKSSGKTSRENQDSVSHPCTKCGKEILSNHGVVKAAKAATYTPASGWLGMTIGMALGGFPGLFLGGLMGGSAGYFKALEEKQTCYECSVK